MELPPTLLEVLKMDGVVAIGTLGPEGPHMVNTWNLYIRIAEGGKLLIPAGYFHRTERNLTHDDRVLVTLGSSKVQGLIGPGTGFLIRGSATFETEGERFETMKQAFSWARAALVIHPETITQTV